MTGPVMASACAVSVAFSHVTLGTSAAMAGSLIGCWRNEIEHVSPGGAKQSSGEELCFGGGDKMSRSWWFPEEGFTSHTKYRVRKNIAVIHRGQGEGWPGRNAVYECQVAFSGGDLQLHGCDLHGSWTRTNRTYSETTP